jgi:hypothetical protein
VPHGLSSGIRAPADGRFETAEISVRDLAKLRA